MEATDAAITRVQTHFANLKAKNAKLTEENVRLKQQVAELKSSNSRIRRIPKKAPGATPPPDAGTPAPETPAA